MTDAANRALVARSLGLYERIALHRESPSSFVVNPRASMRLARWEAAFASLEPGAFDRRLAFDGFDRESVLPLLGDLTLPETYSLPEFVAVVREVEAEMRAQGKVERFAFEQEIPFREYWKPWVEVAKRRLPIFADLPEAVQNAFERSLYRDLATTGAQTLLEQLDGFRMPATSNDLFFARLDAARGTIAARTERYERFIAHLHASASTFLFAFAPLSRLAATRVLFWVRHVSEVLERFSYDRGAIAATLGKREDELGEIVGVDPDLSDSHNGGRRVALLELSSGARIIYKPKSLATELAFQGLAKRLNDLGLDPPLRTIAVLDRERYGWVEYVNARPCKTHAELESYYHRCGALVALVALLRGADCHYENIIADGADPVLIDHEVLLVPQSGPDPETLTGVAAMYERLESSVLRTGMLPQWNVELDGRIVDLSGIGARKTPRAVKRLTFKNINSDEMAVELSADVPNLATNEPSIDGVAHSAGDFEADVLAGLRQTHALLQEITYAKGRIALHALFRPFEGITSRHVVRGTVGYAHLLQENRRPELMTDGLDRSLALDRIARTFLGDERPPAWRVVEAEHTAIAQGDVPCFALRSNERGIYVRDTTTGELRLLGRDVFTRSGFGALELALASFDATDTAIEAQLVAASFSGKAAGVAVAGAKRDAERARKDEDLPPFDDEAAFTKAIAIARTIAGQSLIYRGEHHRVGLQIDDASGTHHVSLLGPALYGGNAGIALFLGAAASLTRDPALREAALTTLAVTRKALRERPTGLVLGLGPGGFEGLGCLLYSFARLARLIDEPSLIDDARLLARAITKDEVEAATTHDLFSGTAGLLLALAALDRVCKTNEHGPAIAQIAKDLLSKAQAQAHGIGWPLRADGRALTGLAHGTAGIAFVLLEAWRLTGDDALREGAGRALAYERSLRDDERFDWPDLRGLAPDSTEAAPFMTTWCNGAPGIALARTRILAIEDSLPDVRDDLELGTRATRLATSAAAHLCCGTGGFDEILFEIGQRTNDPKLADVARRRAFSRIEDPNDGQLSRVVSQAFMRGTAGLGFMLLRMTKKGASLGSVLDLSVDVD